MCIQEISWPIFVLYSTLFAETVVGYGGRECADIVKRISRCLILLTFSQSDSTEFRFRGLNLIPH